MVETKVKCRTLDSIVEEKQSPGLSETGGYAIGAGAVPFCASARPRRFNVLKLDIQGAEFYALQG